MSASDPLGRARRDGEDLQGRGGLARVRERCKWQAYRRRPLSCRGTPRGDRAGVEGLPQRVEDLADLTVLRGVGTDAAVAFVAHLAEGLRICIREAVEHTFE